MAQKLAALELGAFEYANGLTDHAPGARYDFGVPPGLDDLRDHASRTAMLNAVPDFMPLSWLETLQRVAALPSLDPIEWLIAAVASANALGWPLAPELYEAIGRAYLDRLCAACALSIDPARGRILPPSVLVTGSGAAAPALPQPSNEPQLTTPPAKTVPTITQVYEAWAKFEPREAKLVDEWRTAVNRFAQLHDDPPVDQITASMVLAYRRTCAGLPSRAKKEVAALPLLEQVALAEAEGMPTLSSATVNKALSAIRVTLEHAVEEMEVTRLKIDQSFVRDVCSNRHSAAIVRGVITIGRSLGLDVIAEGIETEEQIACLREWRCASGQGYFYGRPIPASDFVQTWRAVDQYARVTVTRAASSTP